MVTMTNEVESWGSPHYKFYGLAKDTKPTENVPENSEFRELDTGADFYFSEGSWHPSPASSDGGSSSGGASSLVIVLQDDGNGTYTGSDTNSDIYNAFRGGQPVVLDCGDGAFVMFLLSALYDQKESIYAFTARFNGDDIEWYGTGDSAVSISMT